MADVIVTLKCVLASPDINVKESTEKIRKEVENFGARILGITTEEVAFGIKAILPRFAMDENLGNYDALEDAIRDLDEVSSIETIQVSRAMG
ncbi:MAG: elongation factor 1-beta [Candidatus Nanoarchaeia archaeon]|nr:elongation factor 1-beta [Candidatus Nanoarchaeia archaeon]